MDFFTDQDRARRKTTWLVVYFILAVILIIASVYVAVAGLVFFGESRKLDSDSIQSLWKPDIFLAVAAGTLIIIAAGSLYKMAQLARGGEVVARSLGGRPVLPNTTDLSERVLLNVVEEMAIAAGTPVPPVYLLEDEPGINAFAAGTTPQNAVIGITRGALRTLKRDELQGVIAHEFSHILNGDMRLNLRLMGILNGILLIAMIGYVLMRTGSRHAYFSSSSSSKKGGNPLPLLGLLLYIIGYVGIFFGHLIKSAVSRQREFLADASAVQFTRDPGGISGALKKIGGLVLGSRLNTTNAEESSHLFFGNGLSASFLNLMSTHPPLPERIRRIDPSFDGVFSATLPIEHSPAEVVNPQTLARQRMLEATTIGLCESHASAVEGAQALADITPKTAAAQVGAPRIEHLEYAASLVSSLPPELRGDVRDPLGAVATIYALLIREENDAVRAAQLDYLSTKADRRAWEETQRMLPFVERIEAEVKLPLVCMVLPALHQLSQPQITAFREDATWLIRADKKVSLFEFAVHRLVLKRLIPRLERKSGKQVKYESLEPLVPACLGLLGALAYAAGNESLAQDAFQQGCAELQPGAGPRQLPTSEDCGLKVVDEALEQIAGGSPQVKKRVLQACAACIGADEHVTVEEAELLRIIADAMECPMPPLLRQRNVPRG